MVGWHFEVAWLLDEIFMNRNREFIQKDNNSKIKWDVWYCVFRKRSATSTFTTNKKRKGHK
jgi:hypothetical protein